MNVVFFWWLLVVVTVVNGNWITGNLCWSMPCMNGGSCFGSAYAYLCICPINYSGVLCEERLGICQENPCGNRGSCIEKSLTSFKCRCYLDYTGPTCEEFVLKKNPIIWSSLSPGHTRILFDMLQEAYHAKVKGKSTITSSNDQIDFIDLLKTTKSIPTTSIPITSTTFPTRTETEHIIQAQNIQLDKIFPDINTPSTLNTNANKFTKQSSQLDNTTPILSYSETDITSTMLIENMTITTSQPTFLNTTEAQEIINSADQPTTISTSTAIQSLKDDITTQKLIEETTVIIPTTNPIDFTSSNLIDENEKFYTSDTTITVPINQSEESLSTNTTAISQTVDDQILYKLCQQILSRISPNVSTSAALTIISDLLSVNNDTANALLSWLNKHFSSSTSTASPLSTKAIPLQRIDMNDVIHQMNTNIDSEN